MYIYEYFTAAKPKIINKSFRTRKCKYFRVYYLKNTNTQCNSLLSNCFY